MNEKDYKENQKIYLIKLSDVYKDGKITSDKRRQVIILANNLKIPVDVATKLENEFLKKISMQTIQNMPLVEVKKDMRAEFKKYEQKQDIVFDIQGNKVILSNKQLHEINADTLLTTSYINSPLDSGILKDLIDQFSSNAKQEITKANLRQIGDVVVVSGEGTKFKKIVISGVCDFNSRIRLTHLALDQIVNKSLTLLNSSYSSLCILPFNKGISAEVDSIHSPSEAVLRNIKQLNLFGKTIYLLFKIFEKKDFDKIYNLLEENVNIQQPTLDKTSIEQKPENFDLLKSIPFRAYNGNGKYSFISYSHRDTEEVINELIYIKEQGVNVWYDEGIEVGVDWTERLGKSILGCTLFIVFISPNSIQSENVRNEINFALAQKKQLLVIHLRQTELTPGMLLQIGSLQALFKFQMAESDYRSKLKQALSLYISNDK